MMRSKEFSLFIILVFLLGQDLIAQLRLSGIIIDVKTSEPVVNAEVFNNTIKSLTRTDQNGKFSFENIKAGEYELIIVGYGYENQKKSIVVNEDTELTIRLSELTQELSEVIISQQREEIYALRRLLPVDGTAIYSGKKTEVILMDQIVANTATNNARQIYSQVVGLNIYESISAGLQLNVGGRGLDPNRTANFNTRQNGYDISADVLGYPESYYTPPAEALSEIQVIRGAASLQYGTQFGGLINFKLKSPSATPIELTSRQSVGSFGVFNSFNSLSGTRKKFEYYTYFNYKRGDGFRPNSGFDSRNFFGRFEYQLGEWTTINFEASILNYLAQQPGGLTDTQFNLNQNFSNRSRNWFEVDWKLFALKLEHKFSTSTDFSLNLFTLDAERNALGFRGNPLDLNSNPITANDEVDINGNYIFPRDLIKGEFNNWGAEARWLRRFQVRGKDAVLLLGSKIYLANNSAKQGPGSDGINANFRIASNQFPDYPNQSNFKFPNTNLAFFGEQILFFGPKLSVTPGFRYEYIKTESDGSYRQVNFDNAGNPIFNQELEDNRTLNRSFFLFGIGLSYEKSENIEIYSNISENYRSVTFSDIRVVNPTFIIDPEISDEVGYTFDLGIRGKYKKYFSYDIGGFSLLYDDRIGIIFDDRANRVRKNIGKALIYGFEIFGDINLVNLLKVDPRQFKLNLFVNTAITNSEYLESGENNVEGNKVEFIPLVNLKSGLRFGYRNLLGSVQYTYISNQFTDVENSGVAPFGDSRNGLIGEIPSYSVLDLSLSYNVGIFRFEAGVNNLLDDMYFTRRATGYPGPGIIPSDPRNYYLTMGFTLN